MVNVGVETGEVGLTGWTPGRSSGGRRGDCCRCRSSEGWTMLLPPSASSACSSEETGTLRKCVCVCAYIHAEISGNFFKTSKEARLPLKCPKMNGQIFTIVLIF